MSLSCWHSPAAPDRLSLMISPSHFQGQKHWICIWRQIRVYVMEKDGTNLSPIHRSQFDQSRSQRHEGAIGAIEFTIDLIRLM